MGVLCVLVCSTNLNASLLSWLISLGLRPHMNWFSAAISVTPSFCAVRLLYVAMPFHIDRIYGEKASQLEPIKYVYRHSYEQHIWLSVSPAALSSHMTWSHPNCPMRREASPGRRQRIPCWCTPSFAPPPQSVLTQSRRSAKAGKNSCKLTVLLINSCGQ